MKNFFLKSFYQAKKTIITDYLLPMQSGDIYFFNK